MIKKVFILIATILLINTLSTWGIVDYYGLTFRSHTVNQDERTGLDLTPEKPFHFSNNFTVEFDLQLQKEDLNYGYICRIVLEDTVSLDLISNVGNQKMNFVIVNTHSVLANVETNEPKHIVENRWIHICIQLNTKEINCKVDSFVYTIPYSFHHFRNEKIFFGVNQHSNFYTTDVPPMRIKNLIIRNEKEKIIREWTLVKHSNGEVFDEIKNSKAVVINGEWDIDQYTKWEKNGEIVIEEKNAQIATDPQQGRVFVATQDSLYIYYTVNHVIERTRNRKGSPFANGGSQMIYDANNNRLISYSIVFPDFITYDFESHEWSSDRLGEGLAPIQQHNRFIDPETNQLVIFGGYGNHTFKSDLSIHSLDGGEWQTNSLSLQITPRFLSATGYLGNGKFLLMGGFGSISGKQEESPKPFYDLYEVDYKKMTSVLLVEFPVSPDPYPYAFGNSLVIDTVKQKIYALAFNKDKFHSEIYLLSVDLKTMKQNTVGEAIPYRFLNTESFSDLFLCKATNKLYAVVLQGKNAGQYSVEFYSLRYPPLQISDILQTGIHETNKNLIISSILLVIILLSVSGIWWYLMHKRSSHATQFVAKEKQPVHSIQSEFLNIQDKHVSTIRLLGGFQVFDKNTEDITGSFSLIMKQLFLFFLLHSIKNGKGVTSSKLDETFWLGMDKSNASNNRSVNIRKLRLLLQEVGDIIISNENSYWHLNLGKEVTCDYYNAILLMKKMKMEESYTKKELKQLLDVTAAGMLLPNTNTEWLDSYKADFSDSLTDLLLKASTQKEIQHEPKLLLRIIDTMLLHDNINEEAIRIKCRVLYQLGQKGLSKQAFDRFYTAYLNILNTKPSFGYEDCIEN